MAKKLVIVESPAKAKTIGRFLGGQYTVRASIGHVRDLPKSQLGVDVERDFQPKYLVPREKKSVVKDLKDAAKGATEVILATDPDREGEAISWHITEAADVKNVPFRRVVFHELTKDAVTDAFKHPRDIDMKLVNAQQARRILDRLVGYKISPILWRKVRGRLSAGRVQSVAVRLIVDREREIEAFDPEEYWTLDAELAKQQAGKRRGKLQSFRAGLVSRLGERDKLELKSEEDTRRVTDALEGAEWQVLSVKTREAQRNPAAPFTTSTLQQEASRKLRFTAKRTMMVAQQLYEGLPIGKQGDIGLITYMRTDSTSVAASAQAEARELIRSRFGAEYLPAEPRQFTRKAKGAQEAHEAIRPTSVQREPEQLKPYLSADQFRLYDLIWKRMVASQMASALFDSTTVDIKAQAPGREGYLFRATGSVIKFLGFLQIYTEGRDDTELDEERRKPLPELSENELLDLLQLLPEQHFTQPPPRYTEATLIKALEELGIGRPSTYAPILSTIQDRLYVEKVDRKFQPTDLGRVVNDLLVEHFPNIVDVNFTARMEEELDDIARGERGWVPVLTDFYQPFEAELERADATMEKVTLEDEPAGESCERCGRPMIIRTGRFGRFIACTGFPECRNTKPLLNKVGVTCPLDGGELVERRTRKGRTFYGCANYPACGFTSWERPLPDPCPHCGGLLVGVPARARCTQCGRIVELEAAGERVTAGR
jgi:DNA topoisomerase-1